MNMKKLFCCIAAAVLLAGCNGVGKSATPQAAATEAPAAQAETESNAAADGDALTVQVQSVENGTVTALVGTLAMGQPPEMPEGEAPGGEAPDAQDGQPPEKPEGDMPGGENPDGDRPEGGTGGFTAGDELVSFLITDGTVITRSSREGENAATIDEIAVGDVLTVVLDGAQQALSVVIAENGPGGAPGEPGGFGAAADASNGTAATLLTEDASATGTAYTSTGDDENALRIDGAAVTLENATVTKSAGASSNTESGDFYGANAALLAENGATVTLKGLSVSSSAKNGNGVFCYGAGTTVSVSDSVIRTTGDNSGGIQTTGGGTMNAENLDIITDGNSAAAIRSDRGGGTVTVDGGSYITNGTGSPAVYSTAAITVRNALLSANASEAVVVEGKNSVALTDCVVSGNMAGTYQGDADENLHAVMIYQSMSGDAEVGRSSFSMADGSLTALVGDLIYVTNTNCTISLRSVALTLANGVLLRVAGNTGSRGWGTAGSNGGQVEMTAAAQTLAGRILVDSISSLALTLDESSAFEGCINPDGEAGTVNVTLSGGSTWKLTADSYVGAFTGDPASVDQNGFTLYVGGAAM